MEGGNEVAELDAPIPCPTSGPGARTEARPGLRARPALRKKLRREDLPPSSGYVAISFCSFPAIALIPSLRADTMITARMQFTTKSASPTKGIHVRKQIIQ
jgi:hypothetical protein